MGGVSSRYEAILEARMITARMSDSYTGEHGVQCIADSPVPSEDYGPKVYQAIEHAKANYIVADLAKIPLQDRFFSITIAHDSIPKHSKDWDLFINDQLPELLRVTDTALNMFPMAIYKTENHKLIEADPLVDNKNAIEEIEKVVAIHGFTFKLVGETGVFERIQKN